MLKIFKGIDGLNAEDFFVLSNYNPTRGHNLKIKKQQCRLNIRKFSFSQCVIAIWNALSQSAIDVPTVNNFKQNYKSICTTLSGGYTSP